MHIYAFGSVCRGDVDPDSDIDLLALVGSFDDRFDPAKYSIYSYTKMNTLWQRGSPFAWHLQLESRLLFSSDGTDVLKSYGLPATYANYLADCEKFAEVFEQAWASMRCGKASRVLDIS